MTFLRWLASADWPLAIERPVRTMRDITTACLRRRLMSARLSPLRVPLSVLVLAVLCVTSGGIAGAEVPPDPAQVARLIRQFSDVSFPKREEASRQLVELGEGALGALAEAARDSGDPDVRLRAYLAMRAIRGRLYGAARQLDGHTEIVVCVAIDRKSTRLNSSHLGISYAV